MQVGALIVDDEEDIRTLIRVIIEAANHGLFVCGEAANGSEAIELADSSDPEVVVLDERMPGIQGLETAKRILERRPGQKIVMCSAFVDPELRQKARAAGITLCLAKNEIQRIPEAMKEVAAEPSG